MIYIEIFVTVNCDVGRGSCKHSKSMFICAREDATLLSMNIHTFSGCHASSQALLWSQRGKVIKIR